MSKKCSKEERNDNPEQEYQEDIKKVISNALSYFNIEIQNRRLTRSGKLTSDEEATQLQQLLAEYLSLDLEMSLKAMEGGNQIDSGYKLHDGIKYLSKFYSKTLLIFFFLNSFCGSRFRMLQGGKRISYPVS
jgi:hypothetical protein